MNAVIPAAMARRLMAGMLAKTLRRPLRRHGRNGRDRRRDEWSRPASGGMLDGQDPGERSDHAEAQHFVAAIGARPLTGDTKLSKRITQ
jgi:hypothetical protein